MTGNVNQSTAGAVQRFVDSCKAAILRANDRPDHDATDAISSAADAGLYLAGDNDTTTLARLNCPKCTIDNWPEDECCGHGQCAGEACQCEPGL